MGEWINLSNGSNIEMYEKMGTWNLAAAVKGLVEALEAHLFELKRNDLKRKSEELPPVSQHVTYEVVMCSGAKLIGKLDECGFTWVKLRDASGKSLIVRTSEVSHFIEQSQSV